MRADERHIFLPDYLELVVGSERALAARIVGHRQVTNAHLLALALRHGARLATLDRVITALAGDASSSVTHVPVTYSA